MKKQIILTGYLLILAAISFWLSWFLMPDPGTTDAEHILKIVKESRTGVLLSVIVQIISSILYTAALFLVTRICFPKTTALTGIIIFGIGILGLCSDAFFHLLAFFMTSDQVNIQEDVVTVMTFMQTDALWFLVPILLPFFIGSIITAIGLHKQSITSKAPIILFTGALVVGVSGTTLATKVLGYEGPAVMLITLGLFASGHAWTGFEFIRSVRKKSVSMTLA